MTVDSLAPLLRSDHSHVEIFCLRAACLAVQPYANSLLIQRYRCYGCASKKKTPKFQLDRGPFASQLDYQSRLQIDAPPKSAPMSSIICTIGPSSQRADVLLELIRAGMRVVRMNFSHGNHEYHTKTIQEARKAIAMYQEETGLPKPVALALDTKGPEIRTGKLAGDSGKAEVELKRGDKVTLSTNKELEKNSTNDKIYVDYQKLPSIVKPGNRIFLDDGLIALVVKETKGEEVVCEVENGGKLGSHKGVNLPGIAVDLPAVTEKDKQDLQFGVDQKVDIIFASFIRDAKAVTEVRNALGPKGNRIKVISKIENQQGMENIDKIILASDGIMVARGDMGIEIPTENVPLAQKLIIAKCNKVGKPVICATQMLDSMTTKPRPSRAEASDVANAIFDGADAVMLSGETAKGKYPAECVRVMGRICAKVESVLWYESIQSNLKREINNSGGDHISAVTSAIAEAATVSESRAIVVACPCSMVAQMISHMRPSCPVVSLTGCPSEAAQSVLYRGVYPLLVEDMVIGNLDFRQVMKSGLKLVTKMDLIEPGQKGSVVLVNAMSADKITFRLFTIKQQTKEEREQEERCQKLALEERCKMRAEKEACRKLKEEEVCRKIKEKEEAEKKKEIEAKCQELKEKKKQQEEAEKCNQLAEELKCKKEKELESKCQKLKAEEQEAEKEKKFKAECQKLKEKEKQQEEVKLCKRIADEQKLTEEKEKEKEKLKAELMTIIKEEKEKFKADQEAKLAEAETKRKEELEKCKKLTAERKKKEAEEECKRKAAEEKKAEMAKRVKQVGAAMQENREYALCKKLEEERKKSKKDMAKELLEAVCKKLKEVKDDCTKGSKK